MTALSCELCGAALPVQAADKTTVCPFCGGTSVPTSKRVDKRVERALVGESDALADAHCPRCAGALHALDVGVRVVHKCAGCEGVWLDPPTVEHLTQERDEHLLEATRQHAPSNRLDRRPKLGCPFCQAPLRRAPLGDASDVAAAPHEYDICDTHGAFFDQGEVPIFVDAQTRRRAGETTDIDGPGVTKHRWRWPWQAS
jgi:Zn-finger nucleic acid-binding protein